MSSGAIFGILGGCFIDVFPRPIQILAFGPDEPVMRHLRHIIG